MRQMMKWLSALKGGEHGGGEDEGVSSATRPATSGYPMEYLSAAQLAPSGDWRAARAVEPSAR
eukprot:8222064-Pyramimonas_sp.AAC.1